MPNYVTTELRFSIRSEEIKSFMKTEDNDFDFRNIVPYPKTEEECPEKYRVPKNENGEYDHNSVHICPAEPPFLDWYRWQCDKWGTKWNACDANWSGDMVYFSTAWSFCEPIVTALSRKFPDVEIEFSFADENLGVNCGKGSVIDGRISYYSLEDPMEFALEMWGETEFWEKDENGDWHYKED